MASWVRTLRAPRPSFLAFNAARRPPTMNLKMTTHLKIAALVAAAAATSVVDGPFPLDKGMMYDHEDVVMESLGMDCAAAFAGASVQRQERPFSPGNIPVVLPRLLSPRVRTPTSTCAP